MFADSFMFYMFRLKSSDVNGQLHHWGATQCVWVIMCLCRKETRLFTWSARGRVIVWFLSCCTERPTPASETTSVLKRPGTYGLGPDDITSLNPVSVLFCRTERRHWTSPPDWSSTRSSNMLKMQWWTDERRESGTGRESFSSKLH